MSIYFFSSKKGEISALVGIKSILLPFSHLPDSFTCFIEDKKSNHRLLENYNNLFSDKNIPGYLQEEIDHFKCLSQSHVAAVFYLRQFIVRIGYSLAFRKEVAKGKIQPRKAFQEVISYWTDYVKFHYVAMPWIEAHHTVTRDYSAEIKSPLYKERVQCALKSVQQLVLLAESDISQDIAQIIDSQYATFQSMEHHKFIEADKLTLTSQVKDNSISSLYCAIRALLPCTLNIEAWPRLLMISILNLRAIIPYLMGRFGFSNSKISIGRLPGIISGDIMVDPIGFSFGKICHVSQEKPFLGPYDKAFSDLFWHILSRLTVTNFLLSCGVEEETILSYYSNLRNFNAKCTPSSASAAVILAEIDYDIVCSLTNSNTKIKIEANDICRSLLELGIYLYEIISNREKKYLLNSSSGLADALNCTYLQI